MVRRFWIVPHGDWKIILILTLVVLAYSQKLWTLIPKIEYTAHRETVMAVAIWTKWDISVLSILTISRPFIGGCVSLKHSHNCI